MVIFVVFLVFTYSINIKYTLKYVLNGYFISPGYLEVDIVRKMVEKPLEILEISIFEKSPIMTS